MVFRGRFPTPVAKWGTGGKANWETATGAVICGVGIPSGEIPGILTTDAIVCGEANWSIDIPDVAIPGVEFTCVEITGVGIAGVGITGVAVLTVEITGAVALAVFKGIKYLLSPDWYTV